MLMQWFCFHYLFLFNLGYQIKEKKQIQAIVLYESKWDV